MTRAVAAARLYIINKWMLIWIPLIIIASMVLLTIAINLIVVASGGSSDEIYFNGAFQAAFWTLLAVALAASTQMFPFAFAMSLTRRDFVLGTLLVAGLVGVAYGFLYALLAWIETVTHGYGINAFSFNLMGFASGPIWQSFLLYGGVVLLFFTAGFASSMLWKRFGGKGLVIAGLIAMVLIAGLAAWAGLAHAWMRIWGWVITQTPVSVGLYALAVSLVLAGGTYVMIRHAEP